MNRNVLRYAVAIAMVSTGVVLASGGEAAARPPALSLYSAASALDATPAKEVSVSCEGDSEVLSGGAYVVGGDRRVHIVRSQPSPSTTGWIAGAQAGPGVQRTGTWQLFVYVRCGYHHYDTGFMGDTEFVTFHSAAASDPATEVVAPCPEDRVVVSVGGRITGGDGDVVLDDLAIVPSTNSVRVRAVETENGSANNWSLWAFAVCAKPTSVPGYEMVDDPGISTTGDKGKTLHCPGTKSLIGFGASMVGAGGNAHYTKLEPQSFAAAVESTVDETGAPAPWTLQVQAVCAFPY